MTFAGHGGQTASEVRRMRAGEVSVVALLDR
jgi:hypothetical protein